jgi:integrase/recombinase XerD
MTTSTAYGPCVNILKKIQVGESWRFAPLKQDAQNRISWNVVFINGLDEIHKEGSFYIEWYENGRRKRESVGKRPHEVLERARRKRLVLDSERAGIEVKDHEATDPRRLHAAMARYLESVKLFKKPSTYKHYRNALGRFQERCTRLFVHQVSRDDLVDFMGYLSGLGLDNRTIYTKTMVVVQISAQER